MFPEGAERDQWNEMGYRSTKFNQLSDMISIFL